MHIPKLRSGVARMETVLITLAAAVPLALPLSGVAHADGLTPGSCTGVQLAVSLATGQPADQTVSGALCAPLWWSSNPRAVDVLVHGATYNSAYWNWPVDTIQYSYVDDTLLAGRATFAYDALGSGSSSHPVSTAITVDTNAYVLHQVINWLHGLNAYGRYNVVGHSLGSIAAVDEAATYHDENALVLTGFTHAINTNHQAVTLGDFYPANLDPEFAGQSLDSGYLTTTPGSRQTLFYSSTADPSIVMYDEAHKDVISGTAFGTAIAQVLAPAAGNIANGVTVPVLEVIGQQDFFYCGTGSPVDCTKPSSVQAYDAPYFTHAASLSVQTTPTAGHDVALHPTDVLTFAGIEAWLITH